jgi:hypothetical protein
VEVVGCAVEVVEVVVVLDRGATKVVGGIVLVAGDKMEAVGYAVEVVGDIV